VTRWFRALKYGIYRLGVEIVAWMLKSRVNSHESFTIWERHGFHVTPVKYYEPIPDTRLLAANYPQKSDLPGVNFRSAEQLLFLQDSLAVYAAECAIFEAGGDDPNRFYLDNRFFYGIDPHVYYCMIRHFKPKTIIEVGAGYSTLVAALAAQQNGPTRIVAVEPEPRAFIQQGAHGIQHMGQRVQDLSSAFFSQLAAGDILFIDSSHVASTGSDVQFLVLEVLPRLRDGVIVHFHDIFLPWDYPPNFPLQMHLFWNEQYLVHAYLAHNDRVKVLCANHFLEQDHGDQLKVLFPDALDCRGASLWLKTG